VTVSASTTHVAAGDQTIGAHGTVDATNYLKINGVDVGVFTTTGTEAVDAINAVFGQTGVKATLNASKITLTAEDGRNVEIDADGTGALISGFADGAGTPRTSPEAFWSSRAPKRSAWPTPPPF